MGNMDKVTAWRVNGHLYENEEEAREAAYKDEFVKEIWNIVFPMCKLDECEEKETISLLFKDRCKLKNVFDKYSS